MFEVDKASLVNAQRVISRVIKDCNSIYLLSNLKEDTLHIIANEPEHYMKVLIAGAKVTKKALVGLKADIFASTLAMRGETYKAEYDKESSKLNINCGSKNSVYVLDVTKDALAREKVDSKKVGISAKNVQSLREMLKSFSFITPDAGFAGSALFKNTKEGMSVMFATVNTCAYYDTEKPISKQEFEVTVPMTMVMDILSIVSSEAEVSISENTFSILSDTVEAVIPTVEDETKGYTEFFNDYRGKDHLLKGKVILVPKAVIPRLSSIRTTSSGSDLVKVTFKGTKGKMVIHSKNGTASDSFEVEKNTLGDMSIEIPEAYLGSTLSLAKDVAEQVEFNIGEKKHLFRIAAEGNGYKFMTVGPVSNEG